MQDIKKYIHSRGEKSIEDWEQSRDAMDSMTDQQADELENIMLEKENQLTKEIFFLKADYYDRIERINTVLEVYGLYYNSYTQTLEKIPKNKEGET